MKRGAAFLLALLLTASLAHADDPKVRAKEAYARGLAAHDAHDFKTAARAFAEADSILPSTTALGAALDACVEADDPVLGAELLERGDRPGATAELTKSIASARSKLGGRAGKIRLVCPTGATCNALIDERSTTRELWVSAGSHLVTTRVDTTMKEQMVEVHPGETVVLSPTIPPPVAQPTPPPPSVPEPAPPPKRKGVSPVITYVGAGITLAMVGGTIATGLLAVNRHDAFEQKGCNKGPQPGCDGIQNAGIPLLVGANLFLGLSILAGVGTGVVAIFFTDWHPSVSATSNSGVLGLGHRF